MGFPLLDGGHQLLGEVLIELLGGISREENLQDIESEKREIASLWIFGSF